MVPIHDSDIASERWSQAEWQHYELWEKIEVKLRRRRNLWILLTAVVFLGLSSIPILVLRWPKWTSLRAARHIGEKVNELKRRAGTENQAFRLEFAPDRKLSYSIVRVPSCSSPSGSGTVVASGSLLGARHFEGYVLLSPEQGAAFGIPGLVSAFCYDPLAGSQSTPQEQAISGLGVISVNDLAEKRGDRMSLVIFRGPTAEVSFE